MKIVLIMYSGDQKRLVPGLLDAHHASGHTELSRAHGAGATGRREENRAWPGDTTVFFSVVEDTRVSELTEALRAASSGLPPGERLHAAVLPALDFF